MRITTVDKKVKMQTVTYSDINYRVGNYKTSAILADLESIRQNILLILGTSVYTKWFRPGIGHRLDYLLFEPMDDLTAGKISDEIFRILSHSALEDRINLQKVDVTPDETNGNYFVEIFYTVPSLDNTQDSTTLGLAA